MHHAAWGYLVNFRSLVTRKKLFTKSITLLQFTDQLTGIFLAGQGKSSTCTMQERLAAGGTAPLNDQLQVNFCIPGFDKSVIRGKAVPELIRSLDTIIRRIAPPAEDNPDSCHGLLNTTQCSGSFLLLSHIYFPGDHDSLGLGRTGTVHGFRKITDGGTAQSQIFD